VAIVATDNGELVARAARLTVAAAAGGSGSGAAR
jgi:hypothetical protein